MYSKIVSLLVLCLAAASLLPLDRAEGSMESEQFHRLKALSPEIGKRVREKEEEFFRRHPELRNYLSRPSEKGILERIRAEKLRRYPAEVAQLIPDTVNVLAIRVEFLEDDTPLTTGNGKMNLSGNGEPMYNQDGSHNFYYDPPHDSLYFRHLMESLRNYYLATSGGKLYIAFDIYPKSDTLSYQLSHQICYYGDPEDYFIGFFMLMRDAIQTADEDTSLHFRLGGQDVYDAYIIFHAGSMWQADVFGDSPCDIVAAMGLGAISLFGESMRTDDGCWINEAIIYPETAFQDYTPSYLQGGLAHEFGHQLGLMDLYGWETYGVGGWALMGTGNWNVLGLVPPHLCAFSSEQLGYIEPVVIDRDSASIKVRYRGSRDTSATKIVKIPINEKEYFLVENRVAWGSPDEVGPDPDSSGRRVWRDGVLVKVNDYDLSLPTTSDTIIGEGGLAIWHVDEELIALRGDTLNFGHPKAVDMEEADGIQDFEQFLWQLTDPWAAFYGSPYDLFFDPNNTSFTPTSTPDSRDNSGANANIFITNISPQLHYRTSFSDTVMSFDLKFDWAQAGFPIEVEPDYMPGINFDVNSPNIADLDGDDALEIVLASPDRRLVYAFRADGTPYTGHEDGYFGVTTDLIYSSPAIGNLDGNPANGLEVVCGSNDTRVYGWHSTFTPGGLADPISGFPVVTEAEVMSSPLLADIDDDGKDELLVGSNDMKLYAWEIEGGSVQAVDGFPVFLGQWIWTTPVAVDSMIYALSGDGRLFKLSNRGDTIWTVLPDNVGPWLPSTSSSPVVGDMDRDGAEEIVVSTGARDIYMVSDQGDVEWQVSIPDTPFYSSPALADLDQDGCLDVVLAVGQTIYGFNKNGACLAGFPIDTRTEVDTMAIQSSPVIGDIDSDGKPEIVIGSVGGRVLAYEGDGRVVERFPLSCGGPVYSTPALTDLDGDGDVEILTAADDGRLYCWDLPGECDSGDIPWPMFRRDPAHLGRYPASLLPPPPSPGDLLPLSKFYIYPNPVSESPAVIRYELGREVESVDIKVFNVAGDLIAELEGKTKSGDQDNRLSLEGIASGLYICRIEAVSGGERVVRFKKFAVIR